MKKIIITTLCLVLIACSSKPATPESISFSAKIYLLAPNGDAVSVYVESVQQDYRSNEDKPDMNFIGTTCISVPNDEVCHADNPDPLFQSLDIQIIESGHWCATPQGQDYSVPEPC